LHWLEYVDQCQDIAARTNRSLHTVDRALYASNGRAYLASEHHALKASLYSTIGDLLMLVVSGKLVCGSDVRFTMARPSPTWPQRARPEETLSRRGAGLGR
jgi:hypothetical protein